MYITHRAAIEPTTFHATYTTKCPIALSRATFHTIRRTRLSSTRSTSSLRSTPAASSLNDTPYSLPQTQPLDKSNAWSKTIDRNLVILHSPYPEQSFRGRENLCGWQSFEGSRILRFGAPHESIRSTWTRIRIPGLRALKPWRGRKNSS